MSKNFRNCPKCKQSTLLVEFAVVQRETCLNCTYFTQRRVTPIVQGGQAMIEHLVDYFLASNNNGPTLEVTLRRQLAKLQRREAKRRNRHNTGKPPREENWR